MTTAATAVYVYALIRSGRRPSLSRVPAGLSGASRPFAAPFGAGTWLVAADVPLDLYGPLVLEPKLRDLDWVASAALSHEAVVESFATRSSLAVVPMKLFTMFSSLERAVEDLESRRTDIARVFKRIGGCDEWGIRVTRAVVSAGDSDAPAGRATTGAAFLARRKSARDAAAAARTQALEAAMEAFERLTRFARDAHRRSARPEPGTNPPVLEAAFLVRRPGRSRFKAEVRRQAARCARAGAAMMLTGPWPAYNFVGEPQ